MRKIIRLIIILIVLVSLLYVYVIPKNEVDTAKIGEITETFKGTYTSIKDGVILIYEFVKDKVS